LFFDPIRVEDLVAGFQQHARRAETLRVEWSVSQKTTTARTARYEAGIKEVEEQRQRAVSDAEKMKLDEIERQIHESIDRDAAGVDNRYYQFDFWTDRQNFQSRCRRDDKTGAPILYTAPGSFVFPDLETTGDALHTHFSTLHVTSFGPATDNRFRVWEGKELFPGVQKGFIETDQSRRSHGLMPPLALPESNWNGEPHLIDQLYAAAISGQAELLGSVDLNGRHTLLIQAIHDRWCYRGFVVVEQGMLPLRVERFVCSDKQAFRDLFNSHVAICESHPRFIAAEICRDIELQEFETADGQTFYYPVRGVVLQIGHSTSPDFALSAIQKEAAVERQDRWSVSRVEFDRPMSLENFAMAFPAGTTFVDSDTREVFVAGNAGETASRFVQGAVASVARRPWYRTPWLMAMSVVALVCVILLAFRRRHNSMQR
jgi:hypothetical protein